MGHVNLLDWEILSDDPLFMGHHANNNPRGIKEQHLLAITIQQTFPVTSNFGKPLNCRLTAIWNHL